MSPVEFREAITALNLNMSAGARFLHIDRRTCGKYLSGRLAVPPQIAMLLSVMVWKRLSPEQVATVSNVDFKRR
jgi:hypothetical protein